MKYIAENTNPCSGCAKEEVLFDFMGTFPYNSYVNL